MNAENISLPADKATSKPSFLFGNLSLGTRILCLLIGGLFLLALKFPIWRFDFFAPQYPGGLLLEIWHNKFDGDVRVINMLNHYIGMKGLEPEMFPELKIMGYIIMGIAALGIIPFLFRKRILLLSWFLVMATTSVVGLYDFYKWEYKYGHELDPTAPIVVPGMAYQPPLIGYKKLLNFEIYSQPWYGGWALIGGGMFMAALLIFEFFRFRKSRKNEMRLASFALPLLALTWFGCSSGGPVPFDWDNEECNHCHMTLSDRHFGAEIVTKTGKAYKFDDVRCLKDYVKTGKIKKEEVSNWYVVDNTSSELVNAETAFYLKSENLPSPMASNIAGFAKQEKRDQALKSKQGEPLSWADILK